MKSSTAKVQKYKTTVWVNKEIYLLLKSKLVLQEKSISDWMQEKINQFLAKEDGKHQTVTDNRTTS